MKATLKLYTPHPKQAEFHNAKTRYRVACFGRQAGKSTACLNDLTYRAWNNPGTTYWYVSPTYDQAKVQYRRLVSMLWPIQEIMLKKNQTELRIKFVNQSQIRFVSGETGQRLRGETLHGAVIDEVRDQHRDLWPQVIRPMLTTTTGWAAFVSTPSGHDHFYDLAERAQVDKDWTFLSAPSTCNPLFTEDELAASKLEMSDSEFRQEIMAEFVDLHRGKAYLSFSKDNLSESNPFCRNGERLSPYLPVIIGLDFNVNPMHWTLGQKRGDDFYWFDEIHIENTNTQECASELIEKIGRHSPGVIVVGDASGNSRHTSASESDYVIICQALDAAGIRWDNRTPDANPPVKERVNTVNARLRDATGAVHMWLNPKTCPHLKRDFERVSWKAGAETILDQKTDPTLTHASDSVGYPVVALSPMQVTGAVGGVRVISRV